MRVIQSSLSNGPIYFNGLPYLTIGLHGPNLEKTVNFRLQMIKYGRRPICINLTDPVQDCEFFRTKCQSIRNKRRNYKFPWQLKR